MDAASRSLEREREAAVDAERPVAGRRGRRHAEPAVVVDAGGAEGEPGELAELVGLLVGEPAAAEHGDGVGAVLGADRREAPRRRRSSASSHEARAQLAVGAPHQRGAGAGPAAPSSSAAVQPFLQSPPAVGREVAPRDRAAAAHAARRAAAASVRVSVIAHCRAQYGQWDAVAEAAGAVRGVIGQIRGPPLRAARP